MVKTIIFDIGGVIVNLDYERVCAPLAELSGRDKSKVREEVENGPIVRAAMKGLIEPREFHRLLCLALGITVGYNRFTEIWVRLLSDNKGIDRIIQPLKSKFKLVLASNTEHIHYSHCVDNFSTLRYFETRFLSYEMGLLKPDQKYFYQVLRGLDQPSKEMLFIDDKQENVESANSVGITALRFSSNENLQAELSAILG